MPEVKFILALDGVPSDVSPGDGRVGAALAAAPVTVSGQTLRLDQAFAGTLQASRNLGDVQDRA